MKHQFEIMPFDSVEEKLSDFPDNSRIAITTSEKLGIERTVEMAEYIETNYSHSTVPHIAARFVENRDHLEDICKRLTEANVDDIFVPAGDKDEPAGTYKSSIQLLQDLEDLEYSFSEVGVTGYPEGHSFISDPDLWNAIQDKEEYATYVVTQICFNPEKINDWIQTLRTDYNVDLPIVVGVPGVIQIPKLINMSRKVGVGESLNFVLKTTGIIDFIKQVLGQRGYYKPDQLVDGLDSELVEGYHYYTFNRVSDTVEWLEEKNI